MTAGEKIKTQTKRRLLLEVPAESKNLQIIRNFIFYSLENSFNKNSIYELEVCLNEICENIIKYSYEENQKGYIFIKIEIKANSVKTTIIDRGKPFNILKYEPPDKEFLFKQEIKGKLGIRTVKTICDKIYYYRLKGKNKTVLIKNISNAKCQMPNKF